jgi:tripeptidyl-peptidase-1
LNELNAVFEAVSDPKNPHWGQFLTQEEIADIVRPDAEAFEAVDAWLAPIKDFSEIEVRPDSVRVKTTVGNAQKLFKTAFFVHAHDASGKELIRIGGSASVPSSVAKYVDFVAGISELFISDVDSKISDNVAALNFAWPIAAAKTTAPKDDIVITPSVLKTYYNVPATEVGTQTNNLQGIAAFTDYFSMGALRAFEKNQQLPQANVTRLGPDCFPSCVRLSSKNC